MGRHKKDQSVQEFRHISERLRRGRVGIHPHCWPEMAAWLIVQQRKRIRALAKFTATEHDQSDRRTKEYLDSLRGGIETIQGLIDAIANPIDGGEWNEAVYEVAKALDIKEGDPLPPQLDPAGRIGPALPPIAR